METLFGKSLQDLQTIVASQGLPSFNATQLAAWLYHHNAPDWDHMSNLSKRFRLWLSENYVLAPASYTNVNISEDGTKKYLFPVGDSRYIETAYIPDEKRHTLCVSTQTGCKMGCLFCLTGRQGFQGNLTAAQILAQLRSVDESSQITNIVFMGMGEPLDNLDEVLQSIDVLTAPWGYALAPRRITLSTIGLPGPLKTYLEKTSTNLAVSLHSPFEEERKSLMPVENAAPFKEVLEVIKQHDFTRRRKLSFEYILFKGVNDSIRHAKELVRLLGELSCRVNLIRFHSIPDSPLEGTPEEDMVTFQNYLKDHGVMTTIRKSRGQDISAACGMLSTLELVKKGKEEVDY